MEYSTTVLVVSPSHHDTNDIPSGALWVLELFWTFTHFVESFCQNTKSVAYIAVMAQPNEPAGATAHPLAVLIAALNSLMPNQPATN